MRSALVVCVLVAAAAGAALAQPAPGPDEVVLEYLKAAYADLSPRRDEPLWPDKSYCRAYGMLASVSKAAISPAEYVASAHELSLLLLDVDLGDPRFDGDAAVVRVKYLVRRFFTSTVTTTTEFMRLRREDGAWRLVLSDDELVKRKAAAQAYVTGPQGRRAPVLPSVCGS